MISPEKIFSVFESGSSSQEEVALDYSKHPVYVLGMFKKMVLNLESFAIKLINTFPDFNADSDNVQEAGEYMVYNRAYNMLKELDTSSDQHEHIQMCADIFTQRALSNTLLYFEGKEEFEKCIIIKEVLDQINLGLEG
jgi:hypothetical protein